MAVTRAEAGTVPLDWAPRHFFVFQVLPIVSIVVPFLVNQNLYCRILTIKLVNQKRNYNGDYR